MASKPSSVRSGYRLAHKLNGKKPLVIHAIVNGDGFDMCRTLCGAHEGRKGYEIQLGPIQPVTCRRCLRAL